MNVRRATHEDLPELVRLGRNFVQRAWEVEFDKEAAWDYLASILDHGAVFVPEGDLVAMLGGLMVTLPFTRDTVAATELFWYSERPGAGRELLPAFERWAVEGGARCIALTALNADAQLRRAIPIYEHRGYTLRESQYVRFI